MAQLSFGTQDGAGRSYSTDSYNTATAAGGQRMSPAVNRRAVGAGLLAAGQKPGGYVPTYAKYAKFAGGFTPESHPNPTATAPSAGFLNGDIAKFQGEMSNAMQGYADIAGQNFKQQVGTLLGNLNGIGALRSGGVQAGVNDAMRTYGQQVGDYASMLAKDAAELGQSQYTYDQEAAERAREYDQNRADAQKAAHRSTIGKILGGAAGGIEAIPGIGTVGKILGGIFG